MRWLALLLLTLCSCKSSEPFYRGLYDVPADKIDEVKADGFTLLVEPPWNDRATLDRAYSEGFKVILPQPFASGNSSPHPAVAGWYLFDEPDLNGKTPEETKKMYRDFKARAGGERAFLTVWNPMRYSSFFEYCDILAPDPYPIREGTDDVSDAVAKVGICVEFARTMAHGRPVWAVLPAFIWAPEFPRFPTPDEERVMAYLAIAKGASSIIWYTYQDLYGKAPPELREAIKKLNSELETINDFLVAPETGEAVWAGDGSTAVSTRRCGGRMLAIIVNADRKERPGRIIIKGKHAEETKLKPLEVRLIKL